MKPIRAAVTLAVAFCLAVFAGGVAQAAPSGDLSSVLAAAGVSQSSTSVDIEGSLVNTSGGGTIHINGASGVAFDGQRAILSGTGNVTHVAQGVVEGVQLLSVLKGAGSAKSSTYNFAFKTLVKEADGTVTVNDSDGQIVGVIDKPWAKDAKGVSLATEFGVSGSRLTQTVTTTSTTAYPVVADPFYWWGYERRFSRSQTNTATTTAGACALIFSLLPSWASKIAGAYCGAVALFANHQYNRGRCLYIRVYYTGQVGWGSYSSGCR